MTNYRLEESKNTKNYLLVMPSSNSSNEYAEECWHTFLREVLVEDKFGQLSRYYRLFSKKAHNEDMALQYDIQCPKCGGKLKKVTNIRSSHNLGLYECPVCDKKNHR